MLLRESLATTGRIAVTKVTLRAGTKESLAVLRAHDDVLLLQTIAWPEAVREPTGLAPSPEVTVRPQEVALAARLMATLSKDFDLTAMPDEYDDALRQLVDARLAGVPVPEVEPPSARAPLT